MTPTEWFIAASLYTASFGITVLAVLTWPRKEQP